MTHVNGGDDGGRDAVGSDGGSGTPKGSSADGLSEARDRYVAAAMTTFEHGILAEADYARVLDALGRAGSDSEMKAIIRDMPVVGPAPKHAAPANATVGSQRQYEGDISREAPDETPLKPGQDVVSVMAKNLAMLQTPVKHRGSGADAKRKMTLIVVMVAFAIFLVGGGLVLIHIANSQLVHPSAVPNIGYLM